MNQMSHLALKETCIWEKTQKELSNTIQQTNDKPTLLNASLVGGDIHSPPDTL